MLVMIVTAGVLAIVQYFYQDRFTFNQSSDFIE